MMSNKRASDAISGEIETQKSAQSEGSTPKRSKLDFLAMIAEMSEKKDEEDRKSPVNATKPTGTVGEATRKPAKSVASTKKPTSSKKPKSENSKSSFAAWKLAKGKGRGKRSAKIPVRKEGGKEPVRKDLPVSLETRTEAVVSEEEVSVSSSPKIAPETVSKGMQNPLLAVLAAAAPLPVNKSASAEQKPASASVPSKKTKAKDPSVTKKNTAPKKAGVSAKKEKQAMPPKKAPKKGEGSSKVAAKSKAKKGDHANLKTASFPQKIMELLQAGLAPNAIYWLPEGEAIAVDPDNFKDNAIISKQFRGNKLSSFVRSLNRWGFRRIFYHSLPDKTLAFYHKNFQKQAPELVKEMQMDGGEKEAELPQGAMATAAAVAIDASILLPEAKAAKKPASPPAAKPKVAAAASPKRAVEVREKASAPPAKPAMAASTPAAVLQAAIEAASKPSPAPAAMQEQVFSAPAPASVAAQNFLDRGGLDRAALERNALEQYIEAQQALQLQQAMAAEQERSDMALQSLQAQQLILQSLADQQNVAHAEELLMQSMIAEQQRSEIAHQQRQAEQALLQQMLAEQETAALAAALRGGGFNAEALLREQLLAQHYGGAGAHALPDHAGSSDILALLQQQLQGHHQQQQQQAREPSYMEQLLLLEQQQQQQRQQEAAILAAHGFHFG